MSPCTRVEFRQSSLVAGLVEAKRVAHHLIVPRIRPPTMAEATTRVFIGSTGSLHDSVEGHVVDDDESHGLPPQRGYGTLRSAPRHQPLAIEHR
jgi:hypothetical protein